MKMPSTHTLLRLAILTCVVVTATALIWSWPWGWLTAGLAGILFIIAHFTAAIERQAQRDPALPAMPAEERARKVLAAEEKVALKGALTIVVGLIAIAVVVAAAVLEWPIVALGALVVFAWLSFLGLPFWLAAIEEEVETEREHLTGETRSIH